MKEFNFYFAGTPSNAAGQYCIDRGHNVLKSWFLEQKALEKVISYKKDGKYNGKIMVDSGAFTAHRSDITINVDDYIAWLNENEPYLECYVQLDQIPGKWGQKRSKEDILFAEKASWENYKYMVSKLKNPYKLLAVFHQDENFENLKRLLDFQIDGKPVPYICISGAKDRAPKDRRDWYHKCFDIIRTSNNPNVKVHCLGCSTYSDLMLFPFYSSNSSTWVQVAAMGSIQDYSTIAVSEQALKNADNLHRFKSVLPVLKQRCELFKLNIEDLKVSYTHRDIYNCEFMLYWIDKNIKNRQNVKIRDRRLF